MFDIAKKKVTVQIFPLKAEYVSQRHMRNFPS
jgi:hypothetical protein